MTNYTKTLKHGGIGPNAPTVGAKLAYIVCTAMEAIGDVCVDTDKSAAQSVINRLVALGCDPKSTAIRAMQFDLNSVIQSERQ